MSESKVKIYTETELESAGLSVNRKKKSNKKPQKKGNIFLRILAVIGVTLGALLLAVYLIVGMICNGPSKSAKQLLVTTVLESGALKFVASIYLSPDEIQNLVNGNSMQPFNNDVDPGLIKIDNKTVDINGGKTSDQTQSADKNKKDIELFTINGRTFSGKLLKISDPSRISIFTVFTGSGWPEVGKTLDQIVKDAGGTAGINGGLYDNEYGLKGGHPTGIVVSHGEIQLNNPQAASGLVMIGFNEDNILIIKSLKGMTAASFKEYVETAKIRDACAFQEESSDKNNHFVQLVINGEARELNGMGSGLNPRTAIGQCADGSILLLVTDGRGYNSHLGASASDLIKIMLEYGAVNAANLDGGSSTCMYYNGEYLQPSVTFKYSQASWHLPLAFVFK